MEVKNSILEKWKDLIYAAKAYWIDSVPTGMDDATFDSLERKAIEDTVEEVEDDIEECDHKCCIITDEDDD